MLRFVMLSIGVILMLLVAGCVVQPITPEAAPPSAGEEVVEEAEGEVTPGPSQERSPFSAEILKNLQYQLEVVGADPVQLTDGVYEDAANLISVNWIDSYALGQLNGQAAAAVVLVANTGGSGVFSILSLVMEQEGTPVNVASTLLGDRVWINWVTISGDGVALDLVTQGPDEPMCCGTQRILVNYMLDGTQLVESAAQVIGVQPQITATLVITFVPQVVPEASQAGSCFTNAIGLGRADAWRCTTDDNLLHDPCFEVDGGETVETPVVVCGADPISGAAGFVLELSEPLPAPEPGDLSRPWLVQLSDGTFCGLLTGTVPGADGQVAPYGCADQARSYLMEEFLIFDPVWFAQSVVIGVDDEGYFIKSSVRIPVATVWH
jgi:hypothetical protein